MKPAGKRGNILRLSWHGLVAGAGHAPRTVSSLFQIMDLGQLAFTVLPKCPATSADPLSTGSLPAAWALAPQ